MEKRDMILLIEVEDELSRMDKVLEKLAGLGHASGDFVKLDNVYHVIRHNSHSYYLTESEDIEELFFSILTDKNKSVDLRAEILLNGTVRI